MAATHARVMTLACAMAATLVAITMPAAHATFAMTFAIPVTALAAFAIPLTVFAAILAASFDIGDFGVGNTGTIR
jgi:hypothetical protein